MIVSIFIIWKKPYVIETIVYILSRSKLEIVSAQTVRGI